MIEHPVERNAAVIGAAAAVARGVQRRQAAAEVPDLLRSPADPIDRPTPASDPTP